MSNSCNCNKPECEICAIGVPSRTEIYGLLNTYREFYSITDYLLLLISTYDIEIDGPIGPDGTLGVIGSDGFDGDIGPPSIPGIQGPQGLTSDGTDNIGNQGVQGRQGFLPIPGGGMQGADGVNGEQGVEGPQGPNGLGAQGIQGAQGAQGSPFSGKKRWSAGIASDTHPILPSGGSLLLGNNPALPPIIDEIPTLLSTTNMGLDTFIVPETGIYLISTSVLMGNFFINNAAIGTVQVSINTTNASFNAGPGANARIKHYVYYTRADGNDPAGPETLNKDLIVIGSFMLGDEIVINGQLSANLTGQFNHHSYIERVN